MRGSFVITPSTPISSSQGSSSRRRPSRRAPARRARGSARPRPRSRPPSRGRRRSRREPASERRDPARQRSPQDAHDRPRRRLEDPALGQARAVLRIGPPQPQPRLDRVQRPQRRGRNELTSVRSTSPCRRSASATGRSAPWDFRSRWTPLPAERNRSSTSSRVGRPRGLGGSVVGDHQRVADRVDVELDQVAAELDRERDRLERVLGRERRRAAMADPQGPAVAPRELDHVRLRTTTAQSSARSPPKALQSSTSALASSSAGSPACRPSEASSRSSP